MRATSEHQSLPAAAHESPSALSSPLAGPARHSGGGLLKLDVPAVGVLGRVYITGGAREFSSTRAIDIITYLAFHRDGADADQLKTWIWPATDPPSDQAFANVMSRARLGLGRDLDGQPFLTRAGPDRVYRLSSSVRTDFDEFQRLVADAKRYDAPEEQAVRLSNALHLVRGRPFTGGTAESFLWADHTARAEALFLIDDTAHRCADLAIEIGDYEQARHAVFSGLRIIAGCEQCYERRFRAAAAARNVTELRAAMNDLRLVLAAEFGEPVSEVVVSRHLVQTWHELRDALV